MQHFLYFLPDPQGHSPLLVVFVFVSVSAVLVLLFCVADDLEAPRAAPPAPAGGGGGGRADDENGCASRGLVK